MSSHPPTFPPREYAEGKLLEISVVLRLKSSSNKPWFSFNVPYLVGPICR